MSFNRANLYKLCTVVILIGFVMLIQPLSMTIFSFGLPVMIAGIIVHIVLDHMNEPVPQPGAEDTNEDIGQ